MYKNALSVIIISYVIVLYNYLLYRESSSVIIFYIEVISRNTNGIVILSIE